MRGAARCVLLAGDRQVLRRHGPAVLLQVGADGELPTEFRLFERGVNETLNGTYLFDERAAELTMAAFQKWGVELMIDLEHLAVAPQEITGDGRSFDGDARGWASLEVRPDGSLWAVNVTWTTDGARRLAERTQRYVSPAFDIDDEGRVIRILNIALTAMPATHEAYPLVARQTEGKDTMNLSEFLKRWHKLSVSQRSIPAGDKLLQLLAIDMKTLQSVVKAMGGDPGGDLTSMFATVRQFAEELAASVTGEPMPEPAVAPEGGEGGDLLQANPEEPEEPATATAMASELRLLRERDQKLASEVEKLRKEREARDAGERRQLVAQLVRLDRETPATAWDNSDGETPRGHLATMPLSELRQRVATFGGGVAAAQLLSVTPRPPSGDGAATAEPGIELSEYETKRLRATVDRIRAQAKQPQATEGHYAMALERYRDHRGQQLAGAGKEHASLCRYGRKIESSHCLSTVTGTLRSDAIKLLTTPVQPIESFGPASQRALEEFRTEYMVNLAAQLADWTMEVGDVLSSGSLTTTFPLDFQTVNYQERTSQGSPVSTPQASEINVKQREFVLAMQGNLKRIMRGDFAYLRSWQQKGGMMARARIKLRAVLIVTLLEANGVWAPSEEYPSGLDTKNFFAQDHLINPFKAGTGTASNLSNATKPLNPDNLTNEKAEVLLVPHFDGVHMAHMADDMLLPTILAETARLLIDVKDIILRDSASKDSSAGVTNEHKDSGMGRIIAPQLAGTTSAANWYLVSRGIIAEGFVPWVLAEDPAEEIREWDQSSDYYKDTGNIKVQSHLGINAVLLWWQGIRKILGS